MKTCLRVTLVFILGALLLVFSERHFLKRYLSYSTIPLSWYDPVENVSGQKDDDIQVATNNTHTISRTALNRRICQIRICPISYCNPSRCYPA